jgi:hypothetical protein
MEREGTGMQRETIKPEPALQIIGRAGSPVAGISHYGMARESGMSSNLMFPAGKKFYFQEGVSLKVRQKTIAGLTGKLLT